MVNMERGTKSLRCIIIQRVSSIPVGVSSCSFFLASALRKVGPRASQFTAGFKTVYPGSGVTGLGTGEFCELANISLQFKSTTSCQSKVSGRGEVAGVGLW